MHAFHFWEHRLHVPTSLDSWSYNLRSKFYNPTSLNPSLLSWGDTRRKERRKGRYGEWRGERIRKSKSCEFLGCGAQSWVKQDEAKRDEEKQDKREIESIAWQPAQKVSDLGNGCYDVYNCWPERVCSFRSDATNWSLGPWKGKSPPLLQNGNEQQIELLSTFITTYLYHRCCKLLRKRPTQFHGTSENVSLTLHTSVSLILQLNLGFNIYQSF